MSDPITCIECGGPLLEERVELGYRYCTRPECQAPHHRGTVVTAIGNNKSADTLIVADPEEIARRGEAGEFARKDTGVGLDYRSGGAVSRSRPTRRPGPAGGHALAPVPSPRWSADQDKVVRLYHDMGLIPSQIVERARRNNPRLGLTERRVVQILSAPPRR
ncbi:hypothetical protein [Pseudonocardia kunmingensis]|uniref:Uncharacterized protein n=1 Tax=Pseudonocardia kunmingensis TaxID=630975 RepID=A0A543CWW0_9PSEU|nr:hypothetical protein [Pseudonocardia kunmingensis]TQM01597.1 hypothetical protein FB558_8486 [Pseudonocardia kunmingensis]